MALIDNIVAYYKLDELSGTREDSHGANDLTPSGTGGVGNVDGKINKSANFISANTQSLNTATPVFNASQSFSISFWVKLTTKVAQQYLVSQGTSTRIYGIRHQSVIDRFTFTVNNSGGGARAVNSDNFGGGTVGIWHHVVGIWNAANAQSSIIVDLVRNDSIAGSFTASNSFTAFSVGRLPGATSYANAAIDEVGVWQKVLTNAEIEELYNLGAGSAYPFSAGAIIIPRLMLSSGRYQ